jgi:ferredoxin
MIEIQVDRDLCDGHGLCEAIAPQFFRLDDEGLCELLTTTAEDKDRQLVDQAVFACPCQAISMNNK